MKRELKGIIFFSAVFLIIDQLIKFFISSKLALNESFVLIKDTLNITLAHNDGAAFSILTGNRMLLICIAVITVLWLIYYLSKNIALDDFDIFTYSLLIGGILGNLLDRIYHGYVIDYISVIINKNYFPVFNFADICIVVSIALILLNTVKGDLWKS